jgi:hypothetical protein
MSFSCPDVRARFTSYAAEALNPDERGFVREHLAVCEACLEAAAAADPTLLFARGSARSEVVSAADMARILEGVRAGVALKQAERRLTLPPGPVRRGRGRGQGGRRKAAAAAAAAVFVLTLALSQSGGPRRAAAPAAPEVAAVTPAFATSPTREGLYGDGAVSIGKPAAGPAQEAGTATVYEIAPGAGSEEPRVVWIVDRSLDI